MQLVSEIDLQEYSLDVTAERMTVANVNEIIFLCQQARRADGFEARLVVSGSDA